MDDRIEAVVTAKTMQEGGLRLLDFERRLQGCGKYEQEELVNLFWDRLLEQSADNRDFNLTDDHGYLICPPERTVATSISLQMARQDTAAESMSSFREWGNIFAAQYVPREGHQFKPAGAAEILDDLEARHKIISALYAKHRLLVLLHEDGLRDEPAERLFIQYGAINRTYAHFALFPSHIRSFIASTMGAGYEFAKLLAPALCFAAFNNGGLPYLNMTIPEDIQRRVSDCGYTIEPDDTVKMIASQTCRLLERAMMLDSPCGGPALKMDEETWSAERRAAHLEVLAAVIEKARRRMGG